MGRPPARPGAGGRGGSPLTSRAALLGLVVLTLVFSAVIPLRTFLAQRGEIAELEREQAAARERVATLERERDQLEDPAFVAAEARRRLHMARPGEVTYLLIAPPPDAPSAQGGAEPDDGPEAPWWTQLWASVDAADAAPEPAPEAEPAPGGNAAEPPAETP